METVSGVSLGHVHDVVVEIEGQLIAQYVVRHSVLSSNEYLIGRDQVVRFEEKKMIVDDGVEKKGEGEEKKKSSGLSPHPVAMRDSGN